MCIRLSQGRTSRPKGPLIITLDSATACANSRIRTKLIEGLEDRLNRIESFVMSDLVVESLDRKADDRHSGTPSTYEPSGKNFASTRPYPARSVATPALAKETPSLVANDVATLRSESGNLSPISMGEKPMDLLATDLKGQSQYIGM